jgi:hypothetical protein
LVCRNNTTGKDGQLSTGCAVEPAPTAPEPTGANPRLTSSADTAAGLFICECSSAACAETVEITPAEYNAIRARSDRFVDLSGHESLELERASTGTAASSSRRSRPRAKLLAATTHASCERKTGGNRRRHPAARQGEPVAALLLLAELRTIPPRRGLPRIDTDSRPDLAEPFRIRTPTRPRRRRRQARPGSARETTRLRRDPNSAGPFGFDSQCCSTPSWPEPADRVGKRQTSLGFPHPTKEVLVALARVVTFEGVDADRIEQMKREIGEGERPEGVPATEIIVLHDADAEKSLVVVFFENEDDYRRGDETLSAMPAGDTPGKRTSVSKYDVAIRMTV